VSSEHEQACHETHCITCGDDGDPMRVLKVDDARTLALCADDAGTHHTVQVDLVSPVLPGDELLVHAGVALVLLSGEEVGS
jgi:hydrogenase maturation factor